MGAQPLVSIITPAYNAERFIGETIQSVKEQSYTNWEHIIVVDKNSKDGTRALLEKLASEDPRIKVLKPTDVSGAADNRNLAVLHAQGEFIAFLDADDLWFPEKLSEQVNFMEEKKINFSYHTYFRMTEDGGKLGHQIQIQPQMNHKDLLKNNTIGCLTVMIRKKAFAGKIQFLNYGWEDMGLWLKLLKDGETAFGIMKPLAYYRIVKGSRSNNKLFAARLRWNTYRQVEKMSFPTSAFYFSNYFVSSLFKYVKF